MGERVEKKEKRGVGMEKRASFRNIMIIKRYCPPKNGVDFDL